jgi:hypothetical protein
MQVGADIEHVKPFFSSFFMFPLVGLAEDCFGSLSSCSVQVCTYDVLCIV